MPLHIEDIRTKTLFNEPNQTVVLEFRTRDDLEKRFREEVFKRLGMKRGNLTVAVQEAIEQWIEKGEKKK